jgi:hypothetical protein
VWQGCPFSPSLFNIYINEILSEWNTDNIQETQLTRNKEIKTLLFADDQVITAESETILQKSTHRLESILLKYGLKISISKTKTFAFRGRDCIRSKIVINNKIIEQINTITYDVHCHMKKKNMFQSSY